jgi:type IV fimbrial biogenesis protein FimT
MEPAGWWLLGTQKRWELLIMSAPFRGFTLVEMMVTVSVLAVLLAVGMPVFSEYMASTRVRSVAENFYSGIQKARAEAIRSNEPVQFLLTDDIPTNANSGALALTSNGKNWAIRVPGRVAGSQLIESKLVAEGGATAVVVSAGGVTTLTFNGLGALTAPAAAVVVSFTHPMNPACSLGLAVRCVNVLISLGGQSRLCEPGRSAVDSRSC